MERTLVLPLEIPSINVSSFNAYICYFNHHSNSISIPLIFSSLEEFWWQDGFLVGKAYGCEIPVGYFFFIVTDWTLGSAQLFGRTSTMRFGPNDRTFFCRTQNFFFRITFNANGILSYFCFAKWPTCMRRYHWSSVIAKWMPREPKLE